MPIYEFHCNSCQRLTTVFSRSIGSPVAAACEHCGSDDLSRLISRTVQLKGEARRIAETDAGRLMGGLDNQTMPDRGEFARWARKMGGELGSEMGAKFRDLSDKAEAGEDPLERVDPYHTLNYALQEGANQASGDAADADGAAGE